MNELIQILAFFLGDGYWLGKNVAFSNTNEDLIRYYAEMLSRAKFKVRIYKRQKSGNRKDEFTLVVEKKFSNIIKKLRKDIWFEINNIEKAKAFLRGIFDAEGTLNFKSTRRGREIKITNTDKNIVSLTQLCLQKLKIKNSLSTAKGYRPNRKKCFNVKTYGKFSIQFINDIKPYKVFSKGYLDGKVNPKYQYIFQ